MITLNAVLAFNMIKEFGIFSLFFCFFFFQYPISVRSNETNFSPVIKKSNKTSIFRGKNPYRRYIPPWMLFETKNKVNVTKASKNVKPATVYLGNVNLRKLLRKSAMILEKVLSKIPHGKSEKEFHNFQREFLHFYLKYIQH